MLGLMLYLGSNLADRLDLAAPLRRPASLAGR
jgi:hypothetical protein